MRASVSPVLLEWVTLEIVPRYLKHHCCQCFQEWAKDSYSEFFLFFSCFLYFSIRVEASITHTWDRECQVSC
jgi:hypothetical protein